MVTARELIEKLGSYSLSDQLAALATQLTNPRGVTELDVEKIVSLQRAVGRVISVLGPHVPRVYDSRYTCRVVFRQ